MQRLVSGIVVYHLAEHLWLAEFPKGMARFVSRDDRGRVVDKDDLIFDSRALACREYRGGYRPNVTYPH